MSLREICEEAYAADPALVDAAEADLQAVFERDPACKGYLQPFLFFKGFLALQTHRVAHWLWSQGRETLAFYLQSRVSASCSRSTSTRPPGSARACSSTTAPASSSARPRWSATTSPCCTA